MVIRSAVGALGAVAMLGALGMALPERGATKAPAIKRDPPFGTLTKADFKPTTSGEAAAPVETAQMLKLASLSTPEAEPKPAPGHSIEAVPSAAAATPAVLPQAATATATTEPGPAASPEVATTAAPVVPAATANPVVKEPIKVASAEEPPISTATPQVLPVARPVLKSKPGLDINKASADDLDHIPGAGRIGRTIVRHRPYRKIEDLVQKRVLRMSAFQRIQSLIKVD